MGAELEDELTGLLRARDLRAAATRAIQAYGPELYGYLVHVLGHESEASEVFAQTSEDLWRGLPEFAGQCSVRTWLYVLARHAAARFRRSPWHRGARTTGDALLDDAVARARTDTKPWLKTDVKDRWRVIRDSLAPDDRSLLVLRVDRELAWRDIARVTLDAATPDDATLERESARLRKRFQELKDELRARAKASGLFGEFGES
jgi:RNA polymerase sigma-70 factor, ECF subfamily